MIWTEEEAEGKWCPLARTPDGDTGRVPVNRNEHGDIDIYSGCFGSECMMWRWYDTQYMAAKTSNVAKEGWEHVPADPNGEWPEQWIEPDSERLGRRRGYCGLAGRPIHA